MIYGKLMLTRPNVLLLDEPTNHLDMETIESLQIGLEHYPGTLIFVVATIGNSSARLTEPHHRDAARQARSATIAGTYDEYLRDQGVET